MALIRHRVFSRFFGKYKSCEVCLMAICKCGSETKSSKINNIPCQICAGCGRQTFRNKDELEMARNCNADEATIGSSETFNSETE